MRELFYIPKQVRILIIFVILLIFSRYFYTGSTYYFFLIWNIFLAFIPFLISGILLRMSKNYNTKYLGIIIIGGIIWLLTFPNAPYLVTDVIHLRLSRVIPMWYDVILLFAAAYVGMLFTFHSLSHIEKILQIKYSKIKSSIFLGLLIFISSFGIYLGRFLRWNSWDVFTNPQELAMDIWKIFVHPAAYIEAYTFTFMMLVFIGVTYYAWKSENNNEK